MRSRRSVSPHLANSLMVGGAALLAAALIAGFSHAATGRVSVGDIIAFEPEPGPVAEGGALVSGRIAVHRPNQYGCILDIDTLRRHGGSLITEARIASEGQTFRLHWAGQRTAPDSGDCGPSADLILDSDDLTRLAVAAGGFVTGGVQPIGTGSGALFSR